MSEQTRKRRQFLADLLFAGGAAVSAALLARAVEPELEPEPVPTPRTQPVMHRRPVRPEPPVNGGMVMKPQLQPVAEGRFVIAPPQVDATPGPSR